ncbi:MAG: glycine cleavage system protein GcvH [Myxococcota bacterium]|nr:glycine cleavage system protein GcvH [Myxococcota bacterium]
MADYEIPEDLHFTAEDEWARADGSRIKVGITDYAQQQLGDIVFIELPEVGASFSRGDSFGVVESVKAVSDLYAPVSGSVAEVNDRLTDSPETVNESCYGDGWLVVFESSQPEELSELLAADAYRKHVEQRSD